MKIEFIYSPIYDNLLTEMSKKEFTESQIKEMSFYKEEIEAIWKKDEKKIISEIEKVAKLKFKDNKKCNVVKHMKYTALSQPLTIKKLHLQRANSVLIHELIHVLLEDNKDKVEKLIAKTYPEDSVEFKIHVPVLLITRRVVENLYGENEFKTILDKEMHIDLLNAVWPEVNEIYNKFNNNIVNFLKKNNLK